MEKNRRITIKTVALLLICIFVLLCGCQQKNFDDVSDNGLVEKIKSQLSNDFSFNCSYDYINLAINGMSQLMVQRYGKDGSFSFLIDRHQWEHSNNYDVKEKVEYYYRYEDDILVCYMRKDGQNVERIEISNDELEIMNKDKLRIVGEKVLFPSYLENFEEVVSGEKYTFSLSVSKILESDSFLSVYLKNVFILCGKENEDFEKIDILCVCETEKDSYRPITISYDFNNLKTYVLSSGALSGEEAFNGDFMGMTIEFDYDLPKTVEVPDDFLE